MSTLSSYPWQYKTPLVLEMIIISLYWHCCIHFKEVSTWDQSKSTLLQASKQTYFWTASQYPIFSNHCTIISLTISQQQLAKEWSVMLDNSEIIGQLTNSTNILWKKLMQYWNCSSKGKFKNFQNSLLLQSFLTYLILRSRILQVSTRRNEVDGACQFIIQNTWTDQQVKQRNWAKEDGDFQQTTQHTSVSRSPSCHPCKSLW